MDESFNTIQIMIASTVALSLPDMEKKFTLVTDCSQAALQRSRSDTMLAQDDMDNDFMLKLLQITITP